MIILDAEEQEPSKQLFWRGSTLRFPEKAASRSDSPLPDYETSEAHQKLIAKELSAKSKRVEPRLWRAILYALGIYVLLTIVIGVPIIVVKKRQQSHSVPVDYGGDNDDPNEMNPNNFNPNIGSFVESTQCYRSELFNLSSFSAYAEQNLTYAGSFYIRSNLSDASSNTTHAIGNLTVDLNPDPSVDKVRFTVAIEASSDDLLRNIATCFINSRSTRGLLIYPTRKLQDSDFVKVNIKMLFPQNTSSTILDNFVTDLPWFSHTFGDLRNHTIKKINLSGARLNVTAGFLKGYVISVKNAYASIVGGFHATSSLALDGIKGDIHANITLEQLYTSKSPTSLFLDTGDGSIDANVTLAAPFEAPPVSPTFPFTADVQTFNGPVTFHADYANSTPPTPLRLTVTNTDGKTDVWLGKKFEGNFSVQSKLGGVVVKNPHHISSSLDPLGKRRQYTSQMQQESDNLALGWVGWGKPKNNVSQGQVKVTTSLSPITLHLGTS